MKLLIQDKYSAGIIFYSQHIENTIKFNIFDYICIFNNFLVDILSIYLLNHTYKYNSRIYR